jgi:hypothetical protein
MALVRAFRRIRQSATDFAHDRGGQRRIYYIDGKKHAGRLLGRSETVTSRGACS